MSRTILSLAIGVLTSLSASAQFYAPATEYHDPVQRVFPVEAARVLAWQANQQSNRIAEITWTVRTGTNRMTTWKLSWLGVTGNAVRTAEVQYNATLLLEGPAFYREVLRQLTAPGWAEPKTVRATETIDAFWLGAASAVLTREESVARGLAITEARADDALLAPRLAGLLAHAALPSIAARVSLDDQLLARSAAWLALTERACSQNLPALWSPVLFLAGRERAAAEVWRQAGVSTNNTGATTDPIAAWDLWLKNPTTKEAYLFALDCTNQPIAMAMLAYDVEVNGSGELMAEVAEPLAGSERTLGGLHNYAPLFVLRMGVGGGHIMNGGFALRQRLDCLYLLLDFSRRQNGYVDLQLAIQSVSNSLARLRGQSDPPDLSLYGFREFAPLLQLEKREGAGKLAPAAVATVGDALNYGWEMAGLQMGTRYNFVNEHWGVPEQALPIFKIVTGEMPDFQPFFKKPDATNVIARYPEYIARLQHVGRIYELIEDRPNPMVGEFRYNLKFYLGTNDTPAGFLKRNWLRPDLFEWQARLVSSSNRLDLLKELFDTAHSEEGPLGAAMELRYLTTSAGPVRMGLPDDNDRIADLLKRMRQPSNASIHAYWGQNLIRKSLLEQAQEVERLFWQNPDSEVEEWIFRLYAKAGAFNAARRFYLQVRGNFIDTVRVSNGIGTDAFVLGYLTDDPELRQMAMKDSSSASYADMVLAIWDAAIRDNRRELAMRADELVERYEPDEPGGFGVKVKNFVSLLPALANAADPQHRAAVTYFGNARYGIILRWIWIEKFKLSKEDAAVFLGGKEAGSFQEVLIDYLEGDAARTQAAADRAIFSGNVRPEQHIVAKFVSTKLLKDWKQPEVPNLKPSDTTSARAVVLKRVKAMMK